LYRKPFAIAKQLLFFLRLSFPQGFFASAKNGFTEGSFPKAFFSPRLFCISKKRLYRRLFSQGFFAKAKKALQRISVAIFPKGFREAKRLIR